MNTRSSHSELFRTIALVGLALLAGVRMAGADTRRVKMEFSDPGNAGRVKVTFTDTTKPANDPNRTKEVPVDIPANCNAQQKRDLIATQLRNAGYTVSTMGFSNELELTRVDTKVKVDFDPGPTMESDVLASAHAIGGSAAFTSFFEPFTPDGQDAIFEAGIVTDLGELRVIVTSGELGYITDGPFIAQELFNRLAPQANFFGADAFLDHDRIEIFIDPLFAQNEAGVIFGTTSPSSGLLGTLFADPPKLQLDATPFIAGSEVTLTATGADPFTTVYFAYSLTGTGNTYIPALDVTLDLHYPLLGGSSVADPLGQATLQAMIPPSAAGLELQLQAAVVGGISPVLPVIVR